MNSNIMFVKRFVDSGWMEALRMKADYWYESITLSMGIKNIVRSSSIDWFSLELH